MAKQLLWLAPICILIGTVGCSICCGPDDYNYGAYGGLHPRSDMQHGRVGSVFSDPSGSAIKLTPHGEIVESVQPQNSSQPAPVEQKPDNELPRPGSDKKKDDGGTKGVDTRIYQPSRFRKSRTRSPRRGSSRKSTQTRRRTASILGGRRYN